MKPPLLVMLWKALFFLEIHFWINSAKTNACSDTGTNQNLQLNITCDSFFDVYVDGKYIGGDEYPAISKLSINTGSEMVAVKCKGIPNVSSPTIIASLSNGLITDNKWKCIKQLESGWNMANFDDLDWPSAIEYETNSHTNFVLPWGQKLDISESAKFIWTADVNNDMEVYCRRSLVTRCSERRFHFFTTRNEWKDKALMNGVLRTTTVESVLECGMNCLNTPQCVSFNIEYVEKKQRICELNKKKDVASPSFRKGLQYFEVIKAGY